jgi:hypothetical protein
MVGLDVWRYEGREDGKDDGTPLGDMVGIMVGIKVGIPEGTDDGTTLGRPVGIEEGIDDGILLGTELGALDGILLGLGVCPSEITNVDDTSIDVIITSSYTGDFDANSDTKSGLYTNADSSPSNSKYKSSGSPNRVSSNTISTFQSTTRYGEYVGATVGEAVGVHKAKPSSAFLSDAMFVPLAHFRSPVFVNIARLPSFNIFNTQLSDC